MPSLVAELGTSFPPSATLCHKCNTKALVIMDGCAYVFELWLFEVWVRGLER